MEQEPIKATQSKEKIVKGAGEFWIGLKEFLEDLIDLRDGLDKVGTIKSIRDNKRMRGANAWLLMCSIMVASLGLDLDSQAVIIGAMLISPLMSPILGIGLAVGINDRQMLSISLNHFGIAIAIALVFSTFYFWLSPFNIPTPEILKRTEPTILDAGIAIFGGIAGIVSGSRKDQSNAIPGVAIATALMPPLCVTGFGIATGNWEIMIKSFYLFFLNAFLVAFVTYAIVRFLGFPLKEFLNPKEEAKNRLKILGFSLLILIPSILIFVDVFKKAQTRSEINRFVADNFENALFPAPHEIPGTDTLEVKLFLYEDISEDSLKMYKDRFDAKNCEAKLEFIKLDPDNQLANRQLESVQRSLRGEFLELLEQEKDLKDKRETEVEKLQKQIDSLNTDLKIFNEVSKEVKSLFPDLEEIGFSQIQKTDFDTTINHIPTFLLKWNKKKTLRQQKVDSKRLEDFIKIRANLDTVLLVKF